MSLPTSNVEWTKIPAGSTVELRGSVYVVTQPDGSQAVAFWGSLDASRAQKSLNLMVARGK
jgi:hypothetical protein